MMEFFGTLLTGILSGGATGLLGVLLQRWFDYKKQAQDIELVRINHANALEVRRLELEAQERMANRAADVQERVADLDAQAREAEAAERSYQVSMQADRATYLAPEAQQTSRLARWLMAVVDFARGIIRPGVTVYALVLLTILTLWVRDMYARSLLQLTPAQTQELTMQVIGTVTYITTTVVVWWFGARPMSRK